MTTFSQIVDELVVETLRPDMLQSIASYENLVIRELHIDPAVKTAVLYSENLYEAQVVADVAEGFTFILPRPQLFQAMEAVWYVRARKYARLRKPSSIHQFIGEIDGQYSYYRTGNRIAFAGYGGDGAEIQLAWYEYPKALKYEPAANRKVIWDMTDQQYKFHESLITPEAQITALENSTNWLIGRHEEIIKQGTRAKIYARLGQYDRSRLSYSLYESLRPGLVDAESIARETVYHR